MKFKLTVWLTLCLFVFNTVFIIIVFGLVYSSLEEALINRSKDKLNAINALKRELLERHFADKHQEVSHILAYTSSHQAPATELTERLMSLTEIRNIRIAPSSAPAGLFEASLVADSAMFEFVYNTGEAEVRLTFGMSDIQDILMQRTGLGATKKSYVVNDAKQLMSASMFFPNTYPTSIRAETYGVASALQGKEGVEIYEDYRGVSVMGCFRTLEFHGIRLALLTEYNLQELMRPIYQIRSNLAALVGMLLVVSLLVSTLLGKLLSRPILKLKNVADQLSQGTLPANVRPSGPVVELMQITESMDKLIDSLRKIAAFAAAIGKGNMQAAYQKLSEHDELGEAVLQMRDQLVSLDREKTALELNSKRILIEAQEKDRERISRDLHDGMGALLTALKLRMEKSGVLRENPEMRDLLERTIAETRSLARNLMPSVLVDFGLNEALSQLVRDLASGSSVKIFFFNELEESEVRLGKDQNLYIYRIVQEGLNNAVKHSGCTEISLSVTVFEEQIVVFIKDNGKGFDTGEALGFKGLGLRNIEERTRLLNGKLLIESGADGTEIEIEIPI